MTEADAERLARALDRAEAEHVRILALTVRQPWASLIARGAKRIETRSWATDYRGPLAIHAGAAFPTTAQMLYRSYPFNQALGFAAPEALPTRAVIAVARLVDVRVMDEDWIAEQAQTEITFGDFAPGRYAWLLDNVHILDVPIACKGSQGLWLWTPPDDLDLP